MERVNGRQGNCKKKCRQAEKAKQLNRSVYCTKKDIVKVGKTVLKRNFMKKLRKLW